MSDSPPPKDAFLAHFLRGQLAIQSFIYAAVRDRATADDLVQEVAAALWAGFSRYDPVRPFVPWARGVAANVLKNHYRRSARDGLVLAPDAIDALVRAADSEATVDPTEADRALRHCMSKLNARSGRLLALRYEQDLDLSSIAQRVGLGAEGVRKALARLRRALKDGVERRLRTGTLP